MASVEQLTDEQLKALYAWIDAIPLSRPKRNIARDFSDGVLFAEVVAAYFPHLVELHNYTPANSMKQKVYNFETLNARVLRKLSYSIPRSSIEEIVNGRPGSVEIVLNSLQFKMAKYREMKTDKDSPTPASPRSHTKEAGYGNESRSVSKNPSSNRVGGRESNGSQYPGKATVMASVDEEILMEKEHQIRELQETVEILELKIAKLEQLVRLKDNKIQKLLQK
jgi:hypothetical protein